MTTYVARRRPYRLGAVLALLVSCSACSLYSIDDRYLQDGISRPYAQRVRAEKGLAGEAYDPCVDDKARRRLALWACNNPYSAAYFKEDSVCAIAE